MTMIVMDNRSINHSLRVDSGMMTFVATLHGTKSGDVVLNTESIDRDPAKLADYLISSLEVFAGRDVLAEMYNLLKKRAGKS